MKKLEEEISHEYNVRLYGIIFEAGGSSLLSYDDLPEKLGKRVIQKLF